MKQMSCDLRVEKGTVSEKCRHVNATWVLLRDYVTKTLHSFRVLLLTCKKCMDALPACLTVELVFAWYPWKSEESIRSPVPEVRQL